MFCYMCIDESIVSISSMYCINDNKSKIKPCESQKVLAHTTVRLQLILFSKITGAFLLQTFGGFLHVPTTQVLCLTGAIISETRIANIYLNIMHAPPQPFIKFIFCSTRLLTSLIMYVHGIKVFSLQIGRLYLGAVMRPKTDHPTTFTHLLA
jgi:hypothetical protein